jgi:hypothetical protein
MKNKIIKIISILILCSSSANGQQNIDKDTFEKLVDYANCKYVETFILKNDKDKIDYFKTYQRDLSKRLDEASLENLQEVLSFKDLHNQLSNNLPAQKLAERINDRKSKYDDYQDDISLINSLSTTVWNNIDLSQTAANIQNSILSKFEFTDNKSNNTKPISEAEVVKTQTIQTSSQVEQLQSKLDEIQLQYDNLSNDTKIIEYQQSFIIFRIIVLSALGLMLLFFIGMYFLFKKNIQEYIIKQVLEINRIEKKNPSNEVKPYNLTEKDINIIANRVLESKLLTIKEIQPQPTIEVKEPIESSKSVSKYLKGKSGKIFNRAESTPDNSFFKLFNENDETAQFEFYGNEAEALAKRIFSEDICVIISGNYQNAHSIITSKPGKIKRVGEQWEVIEPIQIKLI